MTGNDILAGVYLKDVDIEAGVEGLRKAQAQQSQPQAPAKQGMIYVPFLSLYFTDSRILQGTKWQQCKDELKKQGMAMPTPYQFKEFLKYLRDSSEQKDKDLFREITEVRDLWRGEWLNARFDYEDGLYMISENALINGKYVTIEQKLEDVLMIKKQIDMNEWLNSNASHGLPKSNIKNGSLYYNRPLFSGLVAFFFVDSDGVDIDCMKDPKLLSDPALGVFACA